MVAGAGVGSVGEMAVGIGGGTPVALSCGQRFATRRHRNLAARMADEICASQGGKPMKQGNNTSTNVMRRFLDVTGVDAVMIVGRDGFVIESLGAGRAQVELDALGAAVATMVDSGEKMGKELEVRKLEDMFLTYNDAVIVAYPLGDSVLTVLTPDATSLGVIRHNCRRLLPELKEFL